MQSRHGSFGRIFYRCGLCPPVVQTHTHSMPAGGCESRSYSFSRQHEPIVAPKSSKLPKSYRTALFAALSRLACHWRLRLVLLVQVDGTSCVQYMLETWSTPEVRMFLPSYSFTISDRIFACRRSTCPQKASPRTSSIANDSGIALPQPQELCMNAEPRLGALTAINAHNQNLSSRSAYIPITMLSPYPHVFQEHESSMI